MIDIPTQIKGLHIRMHGKMSAKSAQVAILTMPTIEDVEVIDESVNPEEGWIEVEVGEAATEEREELLSLTTDKIDLMQMGS